MKEICGENEDRINSLLFLNCIEAYGFYPDNYSGILELVQSADGSMSQFLRGYKQYLLSNKVDYERLDDLFIDGDIGYLYSDINVPGKFEHPLLKDFGVIIANGVDSSVIYSSIHNCDKYIGYCVDEANSEAELERNRWLRHNYEHIKKSLELFTGNDYVIQHERIPEDKKELCIVRRKNDNIRSFM